jgi:hypothetical protein
MVMEKGEPKLKINAANCVHCKTRHIADPYRSSIGFLLKAAGARPTKESKHGLLYRLMQHDAVFGGTFGCMAHDFWPLYTAQPGPRRL